MSKGFKISLVCIVIIVYFLYVIDSKPANSSIPAHIFESLYVLAVWSLPLVPLFLYYRKLSESVDNKLNRLAVSLVFFFTHVPLFISSIFLIIVFAIFGLTTVTNVIVLIIGVFTVWNFIRQYKFLSKQAVLYPNTDLTLFKIFLIGIGKSALWVAIVVLTTLALLL